jgi:hypothetical protein
VVFYDGGVECISQCLLFHSRKKQRREDRFKKNGRDISAMSIDQSHFINVYSWADPTWAGSLSTFSPIMKYAKLLKYLIEASIFVARHIVDKSINCNQSILL